MDLIVSSSVRFDSDCVSADEIDGSVPGICKYSAVRFGSVPGIYRYSALRFGPVPNLIFVYSVRFSSVSNSYFIKSVRFDSVLENARFVPVPNKTVRFGSAGSVRFLIPS